MTILLHGSPVATAIKQEVKLQVEKLKVCLAVILVGDDPASQIYVNKKIAACEECGIESAQYYLPDTITTEELIAHIYRLNQDRSIHGILVQLPLPQHIDKFKVLNEIDPKKDVDCFTSTNIGLLAQNKAILKPCTPSAIVEILQSNNILIDRQTVTIINDSNVVGRPLAMMLLNLGATPIICHARTPKHHLGFHTTFSEIVISAVGKPQSFRLTEDMVLAESIVIDVGVSKVDGKIIGDAENLHGKVKALTPPVGGVGPVTVAMLMRNTLIAARSQ